MTVAAGSFAVAALTVVGTLAAIGAIGKAAPPSYLTAVVTRADVVKSVTADGSLAPVARYGLTFGLPPVQIPASGGGETGSGPKVRWPVLKVQAEPGQGVAKGAVLAVGDTTDVRKQLSQAASDLALTNARAAQAEQVLQTATDPTKKSKAQSSLALARAAAAATSSVQTSLEAELAHATLVAPADGVIEAVNIAIGADAPQGEALIMDVGGFQASVHVAESDIPALHKAMTVSVAIDALSESISGTIASIGFAPSDGATQALTYPVSVLLASIPANARLGMSVRMSAVVSTVKGVLAVATTAVQHQADGYQVFVVTKDGRAQERQISVGLIGDAFVQVTNGLTEGEIVVVGYATPVATEPALPQTPTAIPSGSPIVPHSPKGNQSPRPHRSPRPSSPAPSATGT